MRKIWLSATVSIAAALSLTACGEKPDSAAKSGASAVIATTNAKVDPVPVDKAKPAAAAKSVAPVDEGDTCGKAKIAAFIGRQDRPTTRADLAKAVGHDNIRWLGPYDAMTMDFSEGRLNVLLDATKRLITGAKCG